MREVVLDPAPDPLDHLEELVGLEQLVVGQEKIAEDVVLAFVELVEVHADTIPRRTRDRWLTDLGTPGMVPRSSTSGRPVATSPRTIRAAGGSAAASPTPR